MILTIYIIGLKYIYDMRFRIIYNEIKDLELYDSLNIKIIQNNKKNMMNLAKF